MRNEIVKYIAWAMVAVLCLAIIGVGYLYFSAQITVTGITVKQTVASENQDLFFDIKEDVEKGRLKGTILSSVALEEPDKYSFFHYTIQIQNNTFLKADMIEVQVVPNEQDVLQLGNVMPISINKKSTGSIDVVILTDTNNYFNREMIVTYYFWGKPFTLRTTLDQITQP